MIKHNLIGIFMHLPDASDFSEVESEVVNRNDNQRTIFDSHLHHLSLKG